ncbi:hypothetical protein [Parapedobacter pyrenivorans]|nr:hypothetical protein [Parapedobacter pyrenivorans]
MANSDLLSECGFVAYFPTEDILLLEGGHTTEPASICQQVKGLTMQEIPN